MRLRPQDTLIRANEQQRRFLASRSPNLVFQGGARSGKTWAGVLKALLLLRQYGCYGMYVAPTYSQLEQGAMPHFRALGAHMGVAQVWTARMQAGMGYIEVPGGGTVLLRSAEHPESLLGATLGWAVADEVGLWRRQAYNYLQDRLSDPTGPRQFAATFTPKGKNWVFDVLGSERPGLEIITTCTFDNPTLPVDYHERLRREHGEGSRYWQQEVMGLYVAWEGLVYQDFSLDRHVTLPPEGTRVMRTVIAVDWGWSNPGVMLPLQLLSNGVWYVPCEVYERERPLEWWAEQGRKLQADLRADAFPADPSEPANIAHLQRAGLPCDKANNEVLPGVTAVAGRFASDRLLIHPSCENLIRELQTYSYKQAADGTVKADEPEKIHDHACDALRYAAMSYEVPQVRRHRIRLTERVTI